MDAFLARQAQEEEADEQLRAGAQAEARKLRAKQREGASTEGEQRDADMVPAEGAADGGAETAEQAASGGIKTESAGSRAHGAAAQFAARASGRDAEHAAAWPQYCLEVGVALYCLPCPVLPGRSTVCAWVVLTRGTAGQVTKQEP